MALAPLSMVYHSENNCPQLLDNLKNFYKMGEFCDVILSSGGQRIHAHRAVLGAFSVHLYQKLKLLIMCPDSTGTHRFTNTTTLMLNDLDYRGLKIMIDFCYSGAICVDSSNVQQVFSVAKTLQNKEVEKLCETFLTAQQNFTSEISSMGIPGPPQERLITHTGPPHNISTTHVQERLTTHAGPRNDKFTSHPGSSQERLTTYGGAQRPISIKIEPDSLLNKYPSAERTNQDTTRGMSTDSSYSREAQMNAAKNQTVIDLTRLASPTTKNYFLPGQSAKSPIRNPHTPPKHLPISPIMNHPLAPSPIQPILISPLQTQLPSPMKYSMTLPLQPMTLPLQPLLPSPSRQKPLMFVDSKTISPMRSPATSFPSAFTVSPMKSPVAPISSAFTVSPMKSPVAPISSGFTASPMKSPVISISSDFTISPMKSPVASISSAFPLSPQSSTGFHPTVSHVSPYRPSVLIDRHTSERDIHVPRVDSKEIIVDETPTPDGMDSASVPTAPPTQSNPGNLFIPPHKTGQKSPLIPSVVDTKETNEAPRPQSSSPSTVYQSRPQSSSPSTVYQCQHCSANFYNSVEFRCHLLNHRPGNKMKTSSKSSTNQSDPSRFKFEHHLRKGGNYRETVAFSDYKCIPCNKYFKDMQALKFHKYNHVLRHTCNVCGKKFSRGWNFLRHKKTHLAENNSATMTSVAMDTSVAMEEDRHEDVESDYDEELKETQENTSAHVIELLKGEPE